MQEKNKEPFLYQEEEIDFSSLILTLLASKVLIIAITLVFTALGALYTFTITPIYQASATVILGNYSTPKITCNDKLYIKGACKASPSRKKFIYSPKELIIDLNLQVLKNLKNSVSISTLNNYSIELESQAISNEIASNSISEIMAYIEKKHLESFENIKNSRSNQVKFFNESINKIEKFEITPLNIKLTHELKIIAKKIDYVNSKQLPGLDKQIDLLENQRLPALLKQHTSINTIIDETTNLQVQYIIKNKLPEIMDKINFYSKSLAENNKLLTQSLDNLENLENSSTTLAALRLTKIQDLKKIIFDTSDQIINLNSFKDELKLELSGLTETKKLLESYKNIGLLENTPTFPSARLVSIPYFQNIIYEYKINLLAIEDKILAIKSTQLPLLKEKRENLRLKLEEFENNKFFFINYTLPEYKILEDQSITKITNINLQKNDYESLLKNHNYINAAISGGIITNDRPFKPSIRRNMIIAFLTGLVLSIFLVLVINLSKTAANNKQTG